MAELGVPGIVGSTEIGRGGFGAVYLGVEEELGREVAVKILPVSLQQRDRDRFDRERRAMGSLSGHPNIVTVHRTGFTDANQPYIVMEYLEEGSMEDRLRQHGPLPWDEAVRIGVALSGAVDAAHQAGILHRDLKPGNVLLTSWGQPKLADFGIARVEGAPETSSSVVTASVAHAGPEIIDGVRPAEASDLYSLASTIFTLIAGRPPFHDPADESIVPMLARIARDPLPRLDGVPDEVQSILARAMAKAPADRHPSTAAFGHELAQVLASDGTAPTEPTSTVPTPNGATAVVAPPAATPSASPSSPSPSPGAQRGPEDFPPPLIESPIEPEQPAGGGRRGPVVMAALGAAGILAVGALLVVVLGGGGGGSGAELPVVTDADYAGYTTIFDTSGAIRATLPEAWDDIDLGGSALLATLSAAADLEAALSSGAEPGVVITANPDPLTDADTVLDELVDSTGCRDRGRDDYDNGAWQGRFHHLDRCGSADGQVWVVVASPSDASFTLVVSAQAVDARDETAARRILDALVVEARAVPGA